ncbi:DUF6029 family protein [Polyangium jinanense]|uniref:Uncharacterized protein n=1 Tax=Polyangium jinanense TaxID=2829994 RepID=A0A9X3WXQ3_9BACT|nr:DUF6029 family protein [Polyangium jinanense]MDC3953744.1 hypothetical protein [Polyangium jinanense]MDC3979135.1 hypothetical protein [Polyangium jinanense]
MSSSSRRAAAALAVTLGSLAIAPAASALDLPGPAGEPIGLDVTNTTVVDYRWDNRNHDPRAFNPRPIVDDDYGEWINRLNVQATWWRFRVGVRLDSALYYLTTTRTEAQVIAQKQIDAVKQADPNAQVPQTIDYANRFYNELNTRFLNSIYPAKLYVGYNQPGLDVTIGDFYAQLGRGLVLSVRKIDELAIDTTIRGGKVVFDKKLGPARIGATLLAGQMNPLRFDEVSGRRLHGAGSPLFFGFPDAKAATTYAINGQPVVAAPRPSYLEDTIFGGRVEGGIDAVQFAANASVLMRKSFTEENLACRNACSTGDSTCVDRCYAEFPEFTVLPGGRSHNQIRTFSGSVNVPSIAGIGDLYVEVAGQQLRDGHVGAIDAQGTATERQADVSGYAVYANANFGLGKLQLSLEAKHNRKFFPLGSNIDVTTPGYSAPEYSVVAYSAPPTAEPIYIEPIESPNVCMTGGRATANFKYDEHTSVYGWLGRYRSWTEVPTNDLCQSMDDQFRTDTWDTAVGIDMSREQGKSHARAWIGARIAERAVPTLGTRAPGETDVLYYEGYIRYDLVKHIKGPFSLQLQGFHRNRYLPATHGRVWNEGENYTALHWSPHLSAVFGYEYSTRPGCQPELAGEDEFKVVLCHYLSGGLTYRSGSTDTWASRLVNTVNLFVGQRRGAIRCVSGVCRLFPPFEGARLEVVSRF